MQEFPPQSAHCRQSSHDGHQLRQTRTPQLALGEARIEDIKLDHKSRDDIPAVLLGLQHLYSHEETREKLFSLLEEHILPGTNRNVGRPGMELWRILVMGVLKQGLGCDFDRVHELVNQHRTVREFLGHGAFSQGDTYELQTIIDNVYLLTPELLSEIGRLVVESGHAVARKKPGEPLRGRCDSFVVETDVHYPTDVNLLWDAMRCLLRELGRAAKKHHIARWRQWRHLTQGVKKCFNKVRSTRRAKSRPDRVEAYIERCWHLVGRAEESCKELEHAGVAQSITVQALIAHARRQMDQVERRLLKGETIAHDEKVSGRLCRHFYRLNSLGCLSGRVGDPRLPSTRRHFCPRRYDGACGLAQASRTVPCQQTGSRSSLHSIFLWRIGYKCSVRGVQRHPVLTDSCIQARPGPGG